MLIRIRTNEGTFRVEDINPTTAKPADVMTKLIASLQCNNDGIIPIGPLCSDAPCTIPLDECRSMADQNINHGSLIHCRVGTKTEAAAVNDDRSLAIHGSLLHNMDRGDYAAKESSEIDNAEWSTAMAAHGGNGNDDDNAKRLGGKRNELSKCKRGNGEVIALLDDDDNDDDVVLISQPASSTATTLNKRKMTNIGKKDKTSSIPPFVPFHLYETTTAKSVYQNNNNDNVKQYFRTIRQMVGMDDDNNQRRSSERQYQFLFVFNFLIDLSYLVEELSPEIFTFHRVVIFYGNGGPECAMEAWKRRLSGTGNTVEFINLIPTDPPRTKTNPLSQKMRYGCHHTKMFILGYEDHNAGTPMCRVVVQTTNLTRDDIEYKTQAAYCQDFPLKLTTTTSKTTTKSNVSVDEDSKLPAIVNPYKKQKVGGVPFDEDDTPFEDDLVTYLESYHYTTRQTWYFAGNRLTASSSVGGGIDNNKPMSWLQLLRKYDYSSAYVMLIPSVPGQHASDSYNNLGYLKLRRAIMEHVCPQHHDDDDGRNTTTPTSSPIICQFSSIGSLNQLWLDRFLSAIEYRSARRFDPIKDHDKGKGKGKDSLPPLPSRIKMIWPTVEEVRTSVEGYSGGGAVPGRVANLEKDFLQPLLHRWSSRNDLLRTKRHIPHIKSYIQPSSTNTNEIEWFVLSSQNLSIAAWGQLQKTSVQSRKDDKVLFMCNWEMGVFFSPTTLAKMNHPAVGGKNVRMVAYPGLSSIINVDSDDENDNDSTTTTVDVILPIPYDLNPTPYSTNDVFWAVDREYFSDLSSNLLYDS